MACRPGRPGSWARSADPGVPAHRVAQPRPASGRSGRRWGWVALAPRPPGGGGGDRVPPRQHLHRRLRGPRRRRASRWPRPSRRCGPTASSIGTTTSKANPATTGTVVRTDPAAGTHVSKQATVNLVVSAGEATVKVPSVVTDDLGTAEALLADAGSTTR